ncbi:MAG: hypothetical protein WBB98_04930 [Xanthobacteraceae bacterium]
MHLSERINALWNQGFNERDIAPMLGISQSAVLFARRGYRAPLDGPRAGTEVRYGTINGGEGHMTCRRVPVTLAYSGTLN